MAEFIPFRRLPGRALTINISDSSEAPSASAPVPPGGDATSTPDHKEELAPPSPSGQVEVGNVMVDHMDAEAMDVVDPMDEIPGDDDFQRCLELAVDQALEKEDSN